MVPTANNHTPTPEPTGDLEQLFRQKLGEAEVAPRMHLWEQIDHELLVQQNETYRRRLLWHRWVAAACILLFLGAGSWLGLRQAGREEVAALGRVAGAGESSQAAAQAATLGNTASSGRADKLYSVQDEAANEGTLAGANQPTLAEAPAISYSLASLSTSAATPGRGVTFVAAEPALSRSRYGEALTFDPAMSEPNGTFFDRLVGAARSIYPASGVPAAAWNSAQSTASVAFAGLTPASQPDTTKSSLPIALPAAASLAQNTTSLQEDKPVAIRPKRWRLMGSYGAGAYNPNMSFASAQTAVSSVPAGAAPTYSNNLAYKNNQYEKAAAEYRQNLRPGFSQRVALTASYAATKHWTISAGVQAAEQQATSQTSYNFLDGRMALLEPYAFTADKGNSLAPPRPATLRTTQYRYRTAGIPVSVRYGSAKNGWSLYAKVGAAVNVLFNTRSELSGVPEATTTYSLSSVGSPYRKLQSSVNGGAGVRYKPAAAKWSVAVGPVAETGLSSLNTSQGVSQARPYAVGMEASVEFGSKPASIVH